MSAIIFAYKAKMLNFLDYLEVFFMNTLEQISHETMVFMRGKYRLDEIGNGKDELKFKQG